MWINRKFVPEAKLSRTRKMKIRHIILSILAAATLAACEKSDGGDPGGGNGDGTLVIAPQNNLYGVISDQTGAPIRGVVVSDGFTCVETDARGLYQMAYDPRAEYVFHSVPADCEITVSAENYPAFYALINKGVHKFRKDFTLKRMSAPETQFRLIAIGDPQVTMGDIRRFREETMADIRETVETSGEPCYGIVLGDVSADTPDAFVPMRTEIAALPGMKTFVTIGNHDKSASDGGAVPDGKRFSAVYGPLDYSFNRGDVHFVCMDNIRFSTSTTYTAGFTDEQVEWLRQDLGFVPKSKMVVLFYHIPIRGASSGNMAKVLDMLEPFREAHLMAGHTHYTDNYVDTRRNNLYEHIHGASCGMWWFSDLNGCGAPNCYYVYDMDGAKLANGYFKGTHHPAGFQMRLHRGGDVCGGPYETFAYASLGAGSDPSTVIANVFNADSRYWKVELYEGGVNRGAMTRIPTVKDDMWTLGYHIGVLGKGHTGGNRALYTNNNKHLYYAKLNDPDAAVKVVATDQWGNVYEQTAFTAPDDYSTAVKHLQP